VSAEAEGELLGRVETRTRRLLIYGLDYLEMGSGPFAIGATALAGVLEIRDAESWGVAIEEVDAVDVWGVRSPDPLRIWDRIEVRLGRGAPTARAPIGEVLSTSGHVVIADLASAPAFGVAAPEADVVCWGSDAARIARELGLEPIGAARYARSGVSVEVAAALERQILSEKRAWSGLEVAIRPHTPSYLLQKRLDESGASLARVEGRTVVGFKAHQDGSWPIFADTADGGALLALRIDLGGIE
jgi:hypothetical protein